MITLQDINLNPGARWIGRRHSIHRHAMCQHGWCPYSTYTPTVWRDPEEGFVLRNLCKHCLPHFIDVAKEEE